MGRRLNRFGRGCVFGILPLAVPCAAQAQATPGIQASGATVSNAVSAPTGQQSVDIIALRSYVGGTPLRHGNLIPGSEQLQLNGKTLTPGEDYAIDYVAGVIYLKVAQGLGDALVASYTFDPKPSTQAATGSSLGGYQFSFLPGTSLILGLGTSERQADGSVINSTLYGWHNAFSFGAKSSMNGLFLFGSQQQAGITNGFSFDDGNSAKPQAPSFGGSHQSKFLLENFNTAFAGGTMSVNYQDISKDFAGFSQVGAAGYSAADVTKYQAEKGLTRTGLSMAGMKFGGLTFDNSTSDVRDDHGQIKWQNTSVGFGGFKFNYNSQKVGDMFGRFADLSETNKDQLLKERGLSRENFSGEFTDKTGKLSFDSQSISDDIGKQSIAKQELRWSSKKYTVDLGADRVDQNFLRIASLTGPETAQWTPELGLKRKWLTFSAQIDPKLAPMTYDSIDMKGLSGKYQEHDAAFTGKSWTLQHIDVGSTPGFASMGAVAANDAAVTNQLKLISSTFGDNPAASPGDKGIYVANSGISRDYTAFGAQLFKKWTTHLDVLKFKGAHDGGSAEDISLSNGSLSTSFHDQVFGPNFSEAASLMPIEQARLGVLPGLRRQDFNFSDQINKGSKLTASNMYAQMSNDSAARTLIEYSNKGFDIAGSVRRVGPNFASAGSLVDPEAALLASMQGFQQRDLKATWNKLPNMTFTGEAQDAKDAFTGETRSMRNLAFVWSPNKTTTLTFTDNATADKTKLATLFNTEMRQMKLDKDFGKYGKFSFIDQDNVSEGNQVLLPSSHSDFASYEAQLNPRVSVKAEETLTHWSNGMSQSLSAETVSTQLTKRSGVSLTEVQTMGNSPAPDAHNTNYGVWYDLGGGVRVTYGYAHQFDQSNNQTTTTNFTVGANPAAPANSAYNTLQPGTLGSVALAAGFGSTAYQFAPVAGAPGAAAHTQGFSNVALSTVKPIRLGPLTNIKFNIGVDNASDYTTWSKENNAFGFSGNLGANSFGFDYNSQLAALGVDGIDRTFHLQTDQSPNAVFKAKILYKIRTLPGDLNYTIRDFDISAKPGKNWEISNQLQTNPEVATPGVFLGTVPQAARSDKWNVDYKYDTNTTFGLTYQEMINEANDLRATTSGITLKLFQKSGSPLSLFFGQEDSIGGYLPHRLTSRYSIEFDQRPGPNKTLSLFLGNVSYDYSTVAGFNRDNWTIRANMQLRF
ncbi:MAG TPA: hypothetical protein VG944_11660 [Fimbriimonas sp.]|nr:hypothetical protein [Fimbriimonas sp.]